MARRADHGACSRAGAPRSRRRELLAGSLSPDHRWVSFVAQRMRNPGTVEIGVVAENSNQAATWTRVLEDHVWPDKPRWSPDGRTLYFLSQGRDGYQVWGVDRSSAWQAERDSVSDHAPGLTAMAHRSRHATRRARGCRGAVGAADADRQGQPLAHVGSEAMTSGRHKALAASTSRMRASTRSMTSSGVEVPAVSPTTVPASNHSGRMSASVSTWCTRAQ